MRNTIAILGALLLLTSCGGDGGKGVIAPTVDVEGQWEVSTNEAHDTCGLELELEGETVPIMLHQTDSDVRMEGINALTGECENVLCHLDGNIMTHTAQTVMSEAGCSIRAVESLSIGFTSTNHFNGTDTLQLRYKSGNCGGFRSCEVRLALIGDRCEGCWPGCERAASFGASLREQIFAMIRKHN